MLVLRIRVAVIFTLLESVGLAGDLGDLGRIQRQTPQQVSFPYGELFLVY